MSPGVTPDWLIDGSCFAVLQVSLVSIHNQEDLLPKKSFSVWVTARCTGKAVVSTWLLKFDLFYTSLPLEWSDGSQCFFSLLTENCEEQVEGCWISYDLVLWCSGWSRVTPKQRKVRTQYLRFSEWRSMTFKLRLLSWRTRMTRLLCSHGNSRAIGLQLGGNKPIMPFIGLPFGYCFVLVGLKSIWGAAQLIQC